MRLVAHLLLGWVVGWVDWLMFPWQGFKLLFGMRHQEPNGPSFRSTVDIVGGLVGIVFFLVFAAAVMMAILK